MRRTTAVWIAAAACFTSVLTACAADDGTGTVMPGPQPNGVAEMKPQRALAQARRAMSELHDAVYETTADVELDGVTKRLEVVDTVTADGCARVTFHPELGRTWVRVLGPVMYLRTNDRASEALGRSPAQVELLRGRWLELRAPALLRGCDLEYLLPARRHAGLLRSTGVTDVAGTPGRRFRVRAGGLSLTFVIATEGMPWLISSRTAGSSGPVTELPPGMRFDGTSVLTDTDTGAEVEAPPDRLVIDPAELQTVPA